jgi:hypothetical protein
VIASQAARGKPCVSLAWNRRLPLDAGAVTQCRVVEREAAPLLARRAVAGTDRQDQTRPVAAADDRVLRPGRAVHEVPGSQLPLLALDDEQCLAGEYEEVLLVGFPVVHRHRLAGLESREVDPELVEVQRAVEAGALELAEGAAPVALPPLRLAGAEDEPALAPRDAPVLGLDELGLRHGCTQTTALSVP